MSPVTATMVREREPAMEVAEPDSDDLMPPPATASDLGTAWERIINDVMKTKALAGAVLRSATPLGVEGGVLKISLAGNHFHRERLADPGNRNAINQAIQRHVPGAKSFELDGGSLSPLPGCDDVVFIELYGATVATGDLTADGTDDVLAGQGPDPTAATRVRGFAYRGGALLPIAAADFDAFSGLGYGVTVATGELGY